jgi:hypothetical protein
MPVIVIAASSILKICFHKGNLKQIQKGDCENGNFLPS